MKGLLGRTFFTLSTVWLCATAVHTTAETRTEQTAANKTLEKAAVQETEQNSEGSDHPNLLVQITGNVQTSSVKCPKKFFRQHDSCFTTSAIRATWAEAQVYCRSINRKANLASFVNLKEAQSVRRHIRKDKKLRALSFWVGGSRMRDGRHWEWLSLRRRLTYKGEWTAYQPDNANGGEFCMLMDRRFQHKWNDMPCHIPHHFVCELRPNKQRRRRKMRKVFV